MLDFRQDMYIKPDYVTFSDCFVKHCEDELVRAANLVKQVIHPKHDSLQVLRLEFLLNEIIKTTHVFNLILSTCSESKIQEIGYKASDKYLYECLLESYSKLSNALKLASEMYPDASNVQIEVDFILDEDLMNHLGDLAQMEPSSVSSELEMDMTFKMDLSILEGSITALCDSSSDPQFKMTQDFVDEFICMIFHLTTYVLDFGKGLLDYSSFYKASDYLCIRGAANQNSNYIPKVMVSYPVFKLLTRYCVSKKYNIDYEIKKSWGKKLVEIEVTELNLGRFAFYKIDFIHPETYEKQTELLTSLQAYGRLRTALNKEKSLELAAFQRIIESPVFKSCPTYSLVELIKRVGIFD